MAVAEGLTARQLCAHRARAQLAQNPDHDEAALALLAELEDAKRSELLIWIQYLLPEVMRVEASRIRMGEFRRIATEINGALDRVTVRVPVDVGSERRYRTVSLIDCGPRELITLAEDEERRADLMLARARAYRRLAAALTGRRKTVGDLPRSMVQQIFYEEGVRDDDL